MIVSPWCCWSLNVDGKLECQECSYVYRHDPADDPMRRCRLSVSIAKASRISIGPGTELKRLLRRFGITPKNCQCDQRAMVMDAEGPAWCREHIDDIVMWLEEAANERKLLKYAFSRRAAKMLILLSVRRAEKKLRIMEDNDA